MRLGLLNAPASAPYALRGEPEGCIIGRLGVTIALLASSFIPAAVEGQARQDLPRKVAGHCGTPTKWVSVTNEGGVNFQPSVDADYAKVVCVIKRLRQEQGVELGFIGNEADPNQALDPGWSLVASGTVGDLSKLASEARKAGWIVDTIAKAEDGTGFVMFRTPEGMTEAQATPLSDRLRSHQFGDVKFGPAPTRNGAGINGD